MAGRGCAEASPHELARPLWTADPSRLPGNHLKMWGPSRCSMRKEALGALASYHEAPQTPGELALSLFSLQRGKLRPIGGE